MTRMINFGIDLGTSNSLIAKFDKGHVEVFKSPSALKETLPSIVGFRNDRSLVGDQARTYMERDPRSVASRFKRKMGTTEAIKIKALNTSKTPVELSSYVLKELKTFVHTGEPVEAAVITIPASFDTVQSNATKEAGLQAGFKQVVLLQEPIAASLAYANKERNVDLKNSQWMVYDLGGGTFDVALVKIVEGELTVVDHEGDNYLGGSDFDALIVERLVVPEMAKRGRFDDLLGQMKSESGRYNRLWHALLPRAEGAKIELSARTSAEIDLGAIRDLEDDDGNPVESILTITRTDLEGLLRDPVDRTLEMMKRILVRNSLSPSDLKFVLMVGGSTYVPYVRRRVEEVMGIPVNTGIDPTNAIAVGAAYFAGTREFKVEAATSKVTPAGGLRVRVAYNRTSQEAEEVFSAKVEGAAEGMQYRIVRDDGSFDSGMRKLAGRIVEDLPLREGAYNIFELKVFDAAGNVVLHDVGPIQIAQGRYNVAGQMLPEDICLVKDDLAAKDTVLFRVFAKNAVLPSKAKTTVEVARTVIKGAPDNVVRIMVVEGPADRHSSTNKPIGVLTVTGEQISRDLLKGTEIDLTFEMSESRDLTVSAYLNGTGQEFSQVFNGKERHVDPAMLSREILALEERIQGEIDDAREHDEREIEERLQKLAPSVHGLMGTAAKLSSDDVTDGRYQLEDRKRQVAQELYDITSGKRLAKVKRDIAQVKQDTATVVREHGNDRERHQLSELLARETAVLQSNKPERVQALLDDMNALRYGVLLRLPDFLKSVFVHLQNKQPSMNDAGQARVLFERGRQHIAAMNWDGLREVNSRLWDLLPVTEQAADELRVFTGIA